jgi:hypothetical protein
MDKNYATKRLVSEKVALLGLFVVSLLLAYLVTIAKSILVLSAPIELCYTGLSVSVPNGNGWHSENQWKHQENGFALSSIFAPNSGRAVAAAHCRYLFAAEKAGTQTKFEQKASLVDGVIVKTDQTRKDNLVIDWAQITKPQTPVSLFFGTIDLPNNRRFDIEVRQITGEANLSEKVFKRIIESLKFKDNELLEAGSNLVAKIKSAGLRNLLDDQNQKVFFLIKTVKDQREHTVGFTMDVVIGSDHPAPIVDSNSQTIRPPAKDTLDSSIGAGQSGIQGAGFFYTRSPYVQERLTSFQSDDSLNEFVWKSETHSAAERIGSEIIVDSNGAMTVRKSDEPQEKTYRLSSAAIPNIFLQQLLTAMLDSDKKEFVVDILRSDGTITPTFISRVETKDSDADKDSAYTLNLEPLGDRGFSEQVYIDQQKQISKRVLHQETTYILERANLADILSEFPEQADSILRDNKIPIPASPEEI